jgi:hypothetical protein
MVPQVVVFLAVAAFASTASALDLRPKPHTYEVEGVKIANVAFSNGADLVTYSPPADWRVSGTEDELQLISPLAQSDARITQGPKTEDVITPQAIAQLKQEILAKLPEDATAIEWSEDRVNPLEICGQPTHEVELSYSAFGKRFKSSLLVCNFTDRQLRFRVLAPLAEFARVYEPFRQSLYTLAGLN